MEAKQEDNGLLASSILSANKLSYRLAPDISVAVSRNNQSQFFQNQSYTQNAVGVCIWNTGSNYVDVSRSSLVLTVRNDSTTVAPAPVAAWFGPNGSACNLINRFTLMSRSGTVIELIQNCNQLAAHTLNYRHPRTWKGKALPITTIAPTEEACFSGGDAQLYGASPQPMTTSNSVNYAWAAGETMRFVIPLAEFSPVFANSKELWPASLCSGLRMEILFELAGIAMMSVAGTATDIMGYTIVDCRVETECYQLSDMVLRTLNDQASSAGLEVVSVTAYDTQFIRTQTAVNVDCSKAVSRALAFVYKERLTPVALGASGVDKFASYPVTSANYPTSFQARIGGLYFPQQAIRNNGAAAGWRTAPADLYSILLQSLNQLGWMKQGVATNFVGYLSQQFCITQSLERSNVLDLSGIPLSNSRLLNVQMEWSTAASVTGDLFLLYAVLIRCFTSGTNVEI